MSTFPTLYKRTSSGALQQWRTWVTIEGEFGVINTEHGQVDGKLQTASDTVREGKNPGKKNATTAFQQAVKEAEAKWRKKQERERYVEELTRAEAGETDTEGGLAPMLAQPHADAKHRLVLPCDGQRKYNGNRCLVVIEDGVTTLWTRKQKRILGIPHIVEAYDRMFAGAKGVIKLDGEIYRHGWSLQKISGFARKETPKEGYLELSHQVYDIPSHSGTWSERREALEALFINARTPLALAETFDVNEEADIKLLHDRSVNEGYEGLILRNRSGKYEEGKRSYDLQKVKEFEEMEFEILGVGEGRGKFEGKAVFVCKTDEGKEFECCAPGTFEERAEFFQQGDVLIGKRLTVKFFEWTDDRKPSHGVGLVVRDYE